MTTVIRLHEQDLKKTIARHRGWMAIEYNVPLPEHDEYLEREPALPNWLSEALSNPQRANLSGANLIGADLIHATLTGAALVGATLSGAALIGAILRNADLTGANLTCANLSRANLSRANLSGAFLDDALLSETNLIEANLSAAHVSGANLIGANLAYANVSGANVSRDALLFTLGDTGPEAMPNGFPQLINLAAQKVTWGHRNVDVTSSAKALLLERVELNINAVLNKLATGPADPAAILEAATAQLTDAIAITETTPELQIFIENGIRRIGSEALMLSFKWKCHWIPWC